ncbi:hypothetical protein [Vogesella sp. XCS3]|uniref:hypothetical protein n=1 Tax=Vogesella sp. XCS3 TaxID=2877939 RepID=UPI001D0AC1A0|nr:hypothetical protein [Vogesella sp. XCS3]UDM18890.1 hypothetical protein LCH97_18645 [Vogesella sp. XCS3]
MDNKRAKAGGQVGLNGEWYAGGRFLPSTALPSRSRSAGSKSPKKALVSPGVLATPPMDGAVAIFAALREFMHIDQASQLATVVDRPDSAIQHYVSNDVESGRAYLQAAVAAYNAGQRWFVPPLPELSPEYRSASYQVSANGQLMSFDQNGRLMPDANGLYPTLPTSEGGGYISQVDVIELNRFYELEPQLLPKDVPIDLANIGHWKSPYPDQVDDSRYTPPSMAHRAEYLLASLASSYQLQSLVVIDEIRYCKDLGDDIESLRESEWLAKDETQRPSIDFYSVEAVENQENGEKLTVVLFDFIDRDSASLIATAVTDMSGKIAPSPEKVASTERKHVHTPQL